MPNARVSTLEPGFAILITSSELFMGCSHGATRLVVQPCVVFQAVVSEGTVHTQNGEAHLKVKHKSNHIG